MTSWHLGGNAMRTAAWLGLMAATVLGCGPVFDPPGNVVAIAGDGLADVSWEISARTGKASLARFVVRSSPEGLNATALSESTTATVTGLTNGTTYVFTVDAYNRGGEQVRSGESNPVTPSGRPGAPTAVSASAGDQEAAVSWLAPALPESTPVQFTVTSTPEGKTAVVAGATQATVGGLSNGRRYTFTVRATTRSGDGPESEPSNGVYPGTVPGAPRWATALLGDARAVVEWTPPAGGNFITGYKVTSSPGGITATTDGATRVAVSGLSNGTSYTFTVTAQNAFGQGPASLPTNPVTPAARCSGPPVLGLAPWVDFGGGRITDITSADFNADGKLDLAFVTRWRNGALIALGRGDGSFQAPRLEPTVTAADSVVVADLNGDARPDLLVLMNNGPEHSLLLGVGDGTFQAPVTLSLGRAFTAAVARDLNGDTKVDLAAASAAVYPTAVVSVFAGNGDGTFLPAIELTVAGWVPVSLISADFNADAKPDLAVATTNSGPSTAHVLLGAGDGFFVPSGTVSPAGGNLVAVDLNGDSKLDLAVGDNGLVTALGNGDGSFQSPVFKALHGVKTWVVAGDFDGDSKADLLFAEDWTNSDVPGYLGLAKGNGDGTVQTPQSALLPWSTPALVVGNFDADSVPDVVASGWTGITVISHPGQGPLFAGAQAPGGVIWWGDLDGDGAADLVASGPATGPAGDGTASVIYRVDGGELVATGSFFLKGWSVTGRGYDWFLGDLAGDARADILGVVGPSGYGGEAEGYGLAIATDSGWVQQPGADGGLALLVGGWVAASADFDRDGRLDVAVRNAPSLADAGLGVQLRYGDGAGQFTAAPPFLEGWVGLLSVGDFDADRIPDVLTTHPGSLCVTLGNGDRTMREPTCAEGLFLPNPPAIADLDGDRALDLVLPQGDGAAVLLGNGDGTFRSGASYPLGPSRASAGFSSIRVADYDGDSKLDLLAKSQQRTATLLLGKGDGTFGPPFQYWLDANLESIGDFDRDGRLDLAIARGVAFNRTCSP